MLAVHAIGGLPGVGPGVNGGVRSSSAARCCRNVSGVRRDGWFRERERRGDIAVIPSLLCVRYCWYVWTLERRADEGQTVRESVDTRPFDATAVSYPPNSGILPPVSISLSVSLSVSLHNPSGLSFRFVLILGVFVVHTALGIFVNVDYHAANLSDALSIKNVRVFSCSQRALSNIRL